MEIFHHTVVKAQDTEKGSSKLSVRRLITREMGAENFVMRLFEIEPEGHSPLHAHPWEHEVFVIEGEGVVVDVRDERHIGPGDVIFVRPNDKHQFKNEGKGSLKFLCIAPVHQ